MANNIYGTVKQAQINPERDVDIYYNYRTSRSSDDESFSKFQKIEDPRTMLVQATLKESDTGDLNLPGMYTLKLPVSIFNAIGVYTVYIVPKEIKCVIADIGVLAAYPDIKGIVIDTNSVDGLSRGDFGNDNLAGYRIEYFNDTTSGTTRQDFFRIVTTSTYCEPIQQSLPSSSANADGYRYNESGTLAFLTVTPSSSPSFKSNAKPYIGVKGQQIVIKNTKFDPVCVEIEMTNHDIETVSYMLEGEQIRNFETGRVTTYNFDGEIYKQMEFSTVKDNYTDTNIAEAKLDKSDNIDYGLNLETIKES